MMGLPDWPFGLISSLSETRPEQTGKLDEPNRDTLGKRLKWARIRKGWTIKQAADGADVSKEIISGAESEHTRPRPGVLLKLAQHYGVPLGWILGARTFDSVGDRLRFARECSGLSLLDVAGEMKMDDATIGNYERDMVQNLPILLLQDLSTLYNVPFEWVMGHTAEGAPAAYIDEQAEYDEFLRGEIDGTGALRKETVGQRIYSARMKKGMSRHDLAVKIGLTAAMIGIYEDDKETPRERTLGKLSKALGVSAEWLTGKSKGGNKRV